MNRKVKCLLGICGVLLFGYISLIVFAQVVVYQIVTPVYEYVNELPNVMFEILGALR